ncbi:uncharacterized protein LOC131236618 isoform X2 [Magnolia sinica]|uniref:uncharacterized protein LOC131236618 isoform X2 n=1 Tax=Magnolia sinica TaxID=86752 RepID=UPI0026596793|nr:uncharacterized protein LOC131236618 isoform X2 [Magnolia sinica]
MMGHEEDKLHSNDGGINDGATVTMGENIEMCCTTYQGTEKDGNLALCRVCQCAESDRRGDAALDFLNITPPSEEVVKINEDEQLTDKVSQEGVQNDVADTKSWGRRSGFMEFVSPEGEVFICRTDIEAGSCHHQDTLINLGCSCKSDLAVAHYACALKWFINHGSTICEICGSVAKNVRTADFRKVMVSLKDYEALRERTVAGELISTHVQTDSGVDPDAVAAIRRQRLSEISLWFNPHNNSAAVSVSVSQGVVDQSSNIPVEVPVPTENPTTKWAVESTGILVATGLLTVTLAWLIAPRVGKLLLQDMLVL